MRKVTHLIIYLILGEMVPTFYITSANLDDPNV